MFNDWASTLIIFFLAACVLWLVWRAVRRLFRSPRRRETDVREPESGRDRQGLALQQASVAVPTIPDAADVLALKAAIDNLARQVAALEKRLASGPASPPGFQRPPEDRRAERPVAISEAPPIVPDHRI